MSGLYIFTVALPLLKPKRNETHSSLFINGTKHAVIHTIRSMKSVWRVDHHSSYIQNLVIHKLRSRLWRVKSFRLDSSSLRMWVRQQSSFHPSNRALKTSWQFTLAEIIKPLPVNSVIHALWITVFLPYDYEYSHCVNNQAWRQCFTSFSIGISVQVQGWQAPFAECSMRDCLCLVPLLRAYLCQRLQGLQAFAVLFWDRCVSSLFLFLWFS